MTPCYSLPGILCGTLQRITGITLTVALVIGLAGIGKPRPEHIHFPSLREEIEQSIRAPEEDGSLSIIRVGDGDGDYVTIWAAEGIQPLWNGEPVEPLWTGDLTETELDEAESVYYSHYMTANIIVESQPANFTVIILATLFVAWAVWARRFSRVEETARPPTPRWVDTAKRSVLWLLAAATLAALITFTLWVGSEWAEAIVQAVAAAGGLGYWMYRSRPRVTLRLWQRDGGVYLELANVGNRIAKRVRLHRDPPIAAHPSEITRIGPAEDFGDMDRGQRHTLLISYPDGIGTLEKSIFRLSHDRTFWFGRYTSTVDMGGSGWNWLDQGDAGTPIAHIFAYLKKHAKDQERQLERIGDLLEDSLE